MEEIKYYHNGTGQVSRQEFRIFQAISGLTQRQIAKEIGCTQPFLSLMINGKRNSIEKVAALQSLMRAFEQKRI